MLKYLNLEKDLIPQELIKIETVFYKENLNNCSKDDFIIAEKGNVPIVATIQQGSLVNANDNTIKFFDLDELNKEIMKQIVFNNNAINQNVCLKHIISNFWSRKIISPPRQLLSSTFNKVYSFFLLDSRHGLEKLDEKENNVLKGIKFIRINCLGTLIAVVNSSNSIILINPISECKLQLLIFSKSNI
jgi:hypothetical protein